MSQISLHCKISCRPKFDRFLLVAAMVCCIEILYFVFLGDIMNPRFSFIGDEYSFFDYAKFLLESSEFVNPFSAGVYEGNSKLASLLQAFIMYFFDDIFLGWRFSSVILPGLISIAVYVWASLLFDHHRGLIACLLCLCSSYLRNFSLVPYPNLQGTLWFVVILCFITYQHREKTSIFHKVCAGICMGLSTYFYYGVAFPIFLTCYIICLALSNGSRIQYRTIAIWLVCAGVLFLPALIDNTMLSNIIWRTAPDRPLTYTERLQNVVLAFLALWESDRQSHFITGPFIDRLTGISAIVGILWAAYQGITRRGPPLALLALWLSTTVGVGLLNGYFYGLAVTRAHFLLIPAFVLAAQGISLIITIIKNDYIRVTLSTILFSLIAILNTFRIADGRGQQLTDVACAATFSRQAHPSESNNSNLADLESISDYSNPSQIDKVLRLYNRTTLTTSPPDRRMRPIYSEIRHGCRS